jgi:photosynthetic reaction center H subunit
MRHDAQHEGRDEHRQHTSPNERDVTPRLVHLDDMSDLQVADGDPDIRGWDVRTADGEKIGTVKDLVIDTGLMKVRYIEAKIDKEVLNAADDRHVLIPIGSARLDDDEDDVYLSSAIVDPRTLPPYDRRALSREYELSLRQRFPTPGAGMGTSGSAAGTERASSFAESATPRADQHQAEPDFYEGDLYDDQRFFGKRRPGRESANYIGPIDDDLRRRNEGL